MDGTVTRALVLAAGQGSRLGPATPKPLLPVLGVPLLARTLFTLRKAGITEAFVVTGHQGERVRREIDGIRRLHEGFTVHWVDNPRWEEPNGVSVLAAADRLDGPFLLTMADHVLDPSALRRLGDEAAKGRDLVLLVDRSPDEGIDPDDATKVAVDGERIAAIGKELATYDAIDTGAFLAGPALLDALRELDTGGRGPSLSDGVRRLASEGKAWVLDGTGMRWQDVDTPADVASARRKLMAAWPKPTDGPVSRWINRPISLRITRLLAPTGVTPNQISLVTLLMGFAAAWFAALGGYAWWLAAALTFQLASILDGTDGELAVLTYRQTEWGAWVDTICDNVSYLAFIVGMTVGVHRAGLPDWYVGWGLVGLAAAALSMGNINMVLRREGRSGSALSVEYAHQQGTRLVDRVLQVLHFLGKRDLIAFLGVVFAVAGVLPWGIPIFGVGASLLLFPVTLQANVAHWVRTRRAAAALVVALAAGAGTLAAQDPTPDSTATPAADSTATSGTFTALTYNVAGLPPGVSKSRPLQNMPRISGHLDGYDLVLVQEDFFFHPLLAVSATHPHKSEPRIGSRIFSREFLDLFLSFPSLNVDRIFAIAGGDRITSDGLNFFSRFPFEGFERHTWASCSGVTGLSNDCLASKGFTWARHTVAPGVTLDVYNVHADAGRRDPDVAARRAQFQQLAAFIALRSVGQAVLVGGDTNLQAPVPADEEILQAFMAATGTRIAGRTLGDRDLVDRFFYRGSPTLVLEPVTHGEAAEFVDGNGAPLSDHPAIRAEFRWDRIPPQPPAATEARISR